MRRWRVKNRLKAAYHSLKDHAKERNLRVTISYEYFLLFAVGSSYATCNGNHASSATVDRILNLEHYVPGNIQIITRSANSIKKSKADAIRTSQGYSWMQDYYGDFDAYAETDT